MMKRTASDSNTEEVNEAEDAIYVVEGVNHDMVMGLRRKVEIWEDTVRGACKGQRKFDYKHISGVIQNLGDYIHGVGRGTELTENWFSGFYEKEDGKLEMITTVAARRVSGGRSRRINIFCSTQIANQLMSSFSRNDRRSWDVS